MGKRMSDEDWSHVDSVETFTHVEARMIAAEYEWGWSTCWFAAEGEFNHYLMKPIGLSFADGMDHALFGWWMDNDDGTRDGGPRDVKARRKMLVYLRNREAYNDMGPIEGFQKMWRD